MKIRYITCEMEEIADLWELMKAYHVDVADNFSHEMEAAEFNKRMATIRGKSKLVNVLAAHKEDGEKVGYCISSILKDENTGEIASLFVRQEYRKLNIGKSLMEQSLTWIENNNVDKKILSVASGNEVVIEYYKQFGFYPNMITLQQK